MIGRLGACVVPCLSVWSASAGQAQVDESALIQKDYMLHRFIDNDARAKLAGKVMAEPMVSDYLQEVVDLHAQARSMAFESATSQATGNLPNFSVALFGRQFPMAGAGAAGGPIAAGGLTIDADQMSAMEELLDALANDDFVRNFTKFSGTMVELSRWFNTTANGRMDLFVETSANQTKEEFVQDVSHFVIGWTHMEMELMSSMLLLEAEFAKDIPKHLFKKDYGIQMAQDAANFTMFVDAAGKMTKPNMTGENGSVYCPFVGELLKAGPTIEKGAADTEIQLQSAKRMLPMVGRIFGTMMPEDDVEAQQMTPRFLFVMGSMLNSSEVMISALSRHTVQLASKLAPLMSEKIGCGYQQAEPVQQSGASSLRHHGMAIIISVIAVWVSLKQ